MTETAIPLMEWNSGRWAELLSAYCDTEYHVASPDQPLVFRLGKSDPEQQQLLFSRGIFSWCIITAWNPYSQLSPTRLNDAAQADLIAEVESRGFQWWEAAGTDPSGNWPSEESCMVLNIKQPDALALCRLYRQVAVVLGDAETEPYLLFGHWEQIGETVDGTIDSGMLISDHYHRLKETIYLNEIWLP